MTCKEIIKHIETWAPKEIAWQKDNVGLQVGSEQREVTNIILCLELTDLVLDDAIKKKCNLIISHHPLLYIPLKKINTSDDKNSRLIETLIKNDITLYSAHTNLDFTRDGVSFELAKVLGLKNIRFLASQNSNKYKLSVFVPENHVEEVAGAVFNAGGGVIGEYSRCSFRTKGEGTFYGSGNTAPSSGMKEKFEKVEEIRLEILINRWDLNKVLAAVKKSHPYEEVAYDVYPLDNESYDHGMGAVGDLNDELPEAEFLNYVSDKLGIKNFRYTSGKSGSVKKVAVCGGAGSDLMRDAMRRGADAFITADLKYHTFHDASGELLLIDAGHYETEIFSLNEVYRRLSDFTESKGSSVKIFKYDGSTNPINFYNN